MFILDGQTLNPDLPFDHDGIQYPANWLRLATPEERAAIGITEVPDYPRPDDRFYWVTQNPDGTYTAIPKDLDGLKVTWCAQVDQTAYVTLLPSDWMVVRRAEDGAQIPANWTTYRASVRTYAQTAKTNLNAAADIDAFIAVATNLAWPASPDTIVAEGA